MVKEENENMTTEEFPEISEVKEADVEDVRKCLQVSREDAIFRIMDTVKFNDLDP
jgi:hypothetical protein